jgi:hypothetical protein
MIESHRHGERRRTTIATALLGTVGFSSDPAAFASTDSSNSMVMSPRFSIVPSCLFS